ncbi:hypothetical protein UFOVP1155_47 [uncultured Caudovirales phage]|uniref:Uncharacterized protein n=1 Tax=uncultured Caudovirales phage TaxID=2100421 RepID=A0A6J5QSH2_9CAUD|nr:hypothetical protein UFOVP1155_47 [uncultured Caudovirales phage]
MKITIEFNSIEEMVHFQKMGFSQLSQTPAKQLTLYDILPDHEQYATRSRNCLVNSGRNFRSWIRDFKRQSWRCDQCHNRGAD